MNCHDISRLVDSGSFGQLTSAQRREAEAHALCCRHCAPIWAAHAQLAQQRIPPMPAELTARVRMLAALPAPATGARTWRRLTVVGCVVALAAAAALLSVHVADTSVSEPEESASVAPSKSGQLLSPGEPEEAAAAIGEATPEPKADTQAIEPKSLPPLPLLPAPVYDSEGQRNAKLDQALQKAVEAHPELVDGPDLQEIFAAGVLMREDGTLLDSVVKVATLEGYPQAADEIERALPKDGGSMSTAILPQHKLTLDGRALRARTQMRMVTVARDYDVTRSNVRVLQILGNRYANHMMPASSRDMKRLTVLLSDDGHILHEQIDNYFSPTGNGRTLMGSDPNDANFLAQSIADRLQINVSEIGLMGVTSIEDGRLVMVIDAEGNMRPDGNRRVLPVYYAWARRPSDPGPAFSQKGPASNRSPLDQSAALRIVERLIPDAFTVRDRAAGGPYVVLSAEGEVIAAGRLKRDPKVSKPEDDIVRDWFNLPDFRGSSFNTVRLRNNLGEQVDVQFTWDVTEDVKTAIKKAEAERAAARAAKIGDQ